MDERMICLAEGDALRMLRHARRSDGLELVPADGRALRDAEDGIEPEVLLAALPGAVFDPRARSRGTSRPNGKKKRRVRAGLRAPDGIRVTRLSGGREEPREGRERALTEAGGREGPRRGPAGGRKNLMLSGNCDPGPTGPA